MAILTLEEKYIQSVRISPEEGRLLREVTKQIEQEIGVKVRESQIVRYLIEEGVPRLKVMQGGLQLV